MNGDEEAMLVELAMRAADSGDAGHWPTVAAVLHDEVVQLRERLADLCFRLAEFERTRSTGGPAPAETRGWANEAIVPAPETAHDQSMAVPDRYQRSDAHLRDRDGAP